VISVMSGMQEELRGKILESTPHLYVLQYSSSLHLEDYDRVVDTIMTMDGISGAAPFILSNVTLMREQGRYPQPAYMFGVDIDPSRIAATDMERQIIDGSLDLSPTESGLSPVLIGSVLADRMSAFEGDTMVVMSMENLKSDMFGGFQPTLRQFEVTGTFSTGMYEYDLSNIYTTLEAAQDLVGMAANDASGIGVRTLDPGAAQEIAERVGDELGYPYQVDSWITRNQALFSALELEKLASTLVMVVSDRTKEIGILRTMGMTQRGILHVFVIQGVWIGVIGTAVGAALGIGVSFALERFELIKIPADVYFVDHLPARMDPFDIAIIIVASIAVAFVATIHPARQASRLEPVDAIRHE
jgi:lipoprotein-releasing system permease protein